LQAVFFLIDVFDEIIGASSGCSGFVIIIEEVDLSIHNLEERETF